MDFYLQSDLFICEINTKTIYIYTHIIDKIKLLKNKTVYIAHQILLYT